jgi:hypothetical protein
MKLHAYVLAVLVTAGTIGFLFLPNPPSTRVYAQALDPCAGVVTDDPRRGPRRSLAQAPVTKRRGFDPDPRGRHLDRVWTHRDARSRRPPRLAPLETTGIDTGEIAVLQDVGDMMTLANPLDLSDAAVRFRANASGGYDVEQAAYGFRQPLGDELVLTDDDTREFALPFGFTFFNQHYDRVFVNSDGNLTFGLSDTASTERSVSRFLGGPPRIAPLFADLDPSTGGRVLTSSDASHFSVTWCGVQQFERPERASIQLTLFAEGTIEVHISGRTTIREAVIGVSPGSATDFVIADLSRLGGNSGGSSAIAERFTTSSGLDVIAVTQRFFAVNPDEFDNVFIFTDQPLLTDAFAYEQTIRNGITGLGVPAFSYSADYGSAGRLESLCNMDSLAKYPDDPRAKFFGENTTLSLMGQEFAHRWLAFLNFRDHEGRPSRALLGRDSAHWSFFLDSDASVLEGNDIADHGGGSFSTQASVQRFSLLDQYAMGLVDQTQVPPFFYVENPTNIAPPRTAGSSPEVGVSFEGIRRNVSIDDVIAVMGPRSPSAADSRRDYRQAFIYVVGPGRTADPLAIEKLDRIRMAWDQFVSAATDSRMRVDTRLKLPLPEPEDRVR